MILKKILPVFLIIALISISFMLTGCKKVKEKEAVDLLNTIFPLRTPTPTPTLELTPTLRSTDSPTPEPKIGLHLTNEHREMLAGLWPAKNTPITDFGDTYKIYGDYYFQDDITKTIFAFYPSMSEDEARIYYGQLIFELDLAESYRECVFVGETNARGDPLEVNFQIITTTNGLEVYLIFDITTTRAFIDTTFDTYWPDNPLIPPQLDGYDPIYRGFTYESDWGDTIGLYNIWTLPSKTLMAVQNEYLIAVPDAIDLVESQNPKTFTPRYHFTYDIFGDGKTKLPIYHCPVFVDFFADCGLVKLAIGAN